MSEQIHRATYGSPERPLKIGIGESGIEIPAYVLEDGTRVLVRTGMIKALGMVVGGGRTEVKSGHAQEGDKLFQFARTKALEPFISKEVLDRAQHPIEFKLPTGASAYGYEATLLPDICNAVLESRQQGKLSHKQEHIARQCEIIVRGLAIVGIIALVDEATGYQDDRVKDALNEIFQKFLLAEAKKYKVRTPLSACQDNLLVCQ